MATEVPDVVEETEEHESIHSGDELLFGDALVDGPFPAAGEGEGVGDAFIWDCVTLGVNGELVGEAYRVHFGAAELEDAFYREGQAVREVDVLLRKLLYDGLCVFCC
uniref:Uncharacterized protein n=1 Tax=Odontella aurita TaxID=265563 RepID=A0A7S4JDM6_9STRA